MSAPLGYVPEKAPSSKGDHAADNDLTPVFSSVSRRTTRDLAFPSLTQAVTFGSTNEYRAETEAGYIRANELENGLAPITSMGSHHTLTAADSALARQVTKAVQDKKIVTWRENDPENPWNWSVTRRWGKSTLPTGF